MKIFYKFSKAIKHPRTALVVLLDKTAIFFPDELFLKVKYWLRMRKKLYLHNPQTFNEKLQWLKLNDRKASYTRMVDKVDAKDYVSEIIGGEYVIPTLGVWSKFEDIDFNILPSQFVLKTTHDSGTVLICKDRSTFDYIACKKLIEKRLKRRYYIYSREWPYKNITPRIIAEPFMVDESGTELKDYKFFCFNGEVKALFIATDRPHDTRFNFYDENFNHLPFTNGHPLSSKIILKPANFERMKVLAEKLSVGIPHLRVDFYNINGKIYFGELTFFHYSGMVPFEPAKWDYVFGSWINLPCNN